MMRQLQGVIHGKTIELTEDPGVADGQQVEITIKTVSSPRPWGEELRRCAGAFAGDWTEEDDRILERIHQERRRDPRGHLGMNFLLDTKICSAHLKRPAGLMHRFVQHAGGLCISTIVLGELYTWAYNRKNWAEAVQRIEEDLLPDVIALDFDSPCANEFGRVRAQLLQVGISVSRLDLLIASVALVHNLTLVTHNTADFQNIPNLRLEDWLTP